ncbi:MAG: hypothetical protein AB4426_09370 [Xenococcaceae cyanobacterium]
MSTYIQGLKPPDTPTQYRAVGFLRATYLPSADKFQRGTLVTGDGKNFPAIIKYPFVNWFKKSPERLDQTHIWSVWPRTIKDSPGLVFEASHIINEYDSERFRQVSNAIDYFSIRGQLWKWDEQKGKLVIKIKRNEQLQTNSNKKKPFYLEIQGRLPVEKECGQFWELKCFRDGEALLLEDGRMVKDAEEMKAIASTPPEQIQKEIKMTEARAEITLKFNTIPEVRTLPKGRVEFYMLAPNGVVFTVNIKGKSWRKAEASMKQFSDWVAMVGGKLGDPTPKGFEVKDAGLQVFEKKPKEPKQTEQTPEPSQTA